MPQWMMIWVNAARFGRPGIARRKKEDVAKNPNQAEMLLPMIAKHYNLFLKLCEDQYILSRYPI